MSALVFCLLGVIFSLVGVGLTLGIITAFIGIPFLLLGIVFLIVAVWVLAWRTRRAQKVVTVLKEGEAVRGEIIEDPVAVQEELRRYFMRHPGNAKYFNIPLTPEGEPDPEGLQRAAEERLIIRLHPFAK